MQDIEIRVYAELNDFVAPERRFRSFPYRFDVSPAVKDVVEAVGVPHTEVDLVLVNGESVDFGHRLTGGDRVAVYPVFEALDITPALRVRPEPLREPRFIADVHLGRLARWLRLAGFDTWWRNDADDTELARRSRMEGRILLTRDRGLLKRSEVTHGCYVRADDPDAQLEEVVARLDLRRRLAPFTRCTACNGLLRAVRKEAVADRLEPGTLEAHDDFRLCEACGRVYWKGSHHQRLAALIEQLRQP